MYGSLVMKMSPSSTVPLYPAQKPGKNDPNCPTIILPSWLAIIGKASCCSRIPGDMAVRNNTASISARAFFSAFSTISSEMGSTSTRLNGRELV